MIFMFQLLAFILLLPLLGLFLIGSFFCLSSLVIINTALMGFLLLILAGLVFFISSNFILALIFLFLFIFVWFFNFSKILAPDLKKEGLILELDAKDKRGKNHFSLLGLLPWIFIRILLNLIYRIKKIKITKEDLRDFSLFIRTKEAQIKILFK